MPRGVVTGPGDEYDAHEEAALEAAVDQAWEEYEAMRRTPTRVTVRAQVEWAGVTQASNNGMRRVRLDGLDLRAVRDRLEAAREATRRAAEARPARSLQAKGWHAQLRALTGSRRGSEYADRVGLNPSARALRSWLSEDRAPSKVNQARIAAAYEAMRNRAVDEARARAQRATHELQEAFTEALRDRYGATIRFRNIEEFRFEN